MTYQKRYLTNQVQQDLSKKMVFIGGPRQVGKTTLAKHFLKNSQQGYLNWDNTEQREKILKREFPSSSLWIFDEIHKYKNWRNYLKGLYDVHHPKHHILVTGSARLDYYRRGGDSLQGRYHYLRLHPLSVAELKINSLNDFHVLLKRGGFPEPFLADSDVDSKRWSREYRQRFLDEDVYTMERVHDMGSLELLMLRLPQLVGSPLSINAIREDLQVSHKTITNWLQILERLYALFRLSPFGAPKIRAVKKEQKHYHFDWSLIESDSFRFENLMASHLLKWVHFEQDTKGRDIDLRYFRDIDGREVDFIIIEKEKPIIAIEAKWNDAEVSKGLRYFKNHFPSCEALQLSAVGKKDYVTQEDIRVCSALTYLQNLGV